MLLTLAMPCVVAQDSEWIAHILSNTTSSEGSIVRMQQGSSTQYTTLAPAVGNVGVFYGNKYYIAFHKGEENLTTYTHNTGDWNSTATTYNQYPDYLNPTSVVYHPEEELIYSLYRNSESKKYECQALQYSDNTFTPQGTSVELAKPYYALCTTDDGTTYGFGTDAGLYRLDLHSGESEKLFATTSVGNANQSAWINNDAGVIYRAVASSIGVTLYSYDIEAQSEKYVKIYTAIKGIVAMTPDNFVVLNSIPSPVSDLAITWNGNPNVGEITFTAPHSDINGEAMTNELNIEIAVDNINVATINCMPGESCTHTHTFTDGTHTVTIVARNEHGESDATRCDLFAGYDTPQPVGNITLTTHFPHIDIAWQQPEGVHGHILNIEELRYRITRYPDNVIIADTTATLVHDTLPNIPSTYYYGIVCYLPEYQANESYSESFLYDCIIEPPYSLTQWNSEIVTSFIIHDENEDGCTWQYAENESNGAGMQYTYSHYNDADDYLYLPPMKLREGTCYEAVFHAHAGSNLYSEQMSIGIVPADELDERTTLADKITIKGTESHPHRALFSVTDEGSYRLYLHCTSPANHHTLHIDSIAVREYGNTSAPQAATELHLTVDSNNPTQVAIQCTAPTHSIDGERLTTIGKLTILRNGEVILTIDNPLPGTLISHNDHVESLGTYHYEIVASNEAGEGNSTSKSIVCGAATAPYKCDFTHGAPYFTIIDNNNDGVTWHYNEERFMGCMRYLSSEKQDADDWLITPPLHLSSNTHYQITYSCCAGLSFYPESMRVVMGLQPQPNVMSMVIDDLTNFTFINDSTITATFSTPLTGYYYIAFQATSPADSYAIILRSVEIDYALSASNTLSDNTKVWGDDNRIYYSCPTGSDITLYDTMGHIVLQITTTTTPGSYHMTAGVYIAKVGNSTHKIVVH